MRVERCEGLGSECIDVVSISHDMTQNERQGLGGQGFGSQALGSQALGGQALGLRVSGVRVSGSGVACVPIP